VADLIELKKAQLVKDVVAQVAKPGEQSNL